MCDIVTINLPVGECLSWSRTVRGKQNVFKRIHVSGYLRDLQNVWKRVLFFLFFIVFFYVLFEKNHPLYAGIGVYLSRVHVRRKNTWAQRLWNFE